MSLPYQLNQFSPRALNFLGSLLFGQEARVVLSSRLTAPAVVALESRTVLLDEARAGLYDLCLAARLLRFRREARQRPGKKDRVSRKTVRRWVEEAEASLLRDYPRIQQLPGYFHPQGRQDVPEVVWKTVRYRRLGDEDLAGLGQGGQLLQVPGVSFSDVGDDFAWLAEAMESGRYPLEELPELREMPVATVHLTIPFSQEHGPKFERLEEHLAENRDLVQNLMNCYRRKSEGLNELNPLGRRTMSG